MRNYRKSFVSIQFQWKHFRYLTTVLTLIFSRSDRTNLETPVANTTDRYLAMRYSVLLFATSPCKVRYLWEFSRKNRKMGQSIFKPLFYIFSLLSNHFVYGAVRRANTKDKQEGQLLEFLRTVYWPSAYYIYLIYETVGPYIPFLQFACLPLLARI